MPWLRESNLVTIHWIKSNRYGKNILWSFKICGFFLEKSKWQIWIWVFVFDKWNCDPLASYFTYISKIVLNWMLDHEVSIYLASKYLASVTFNHVKWSHTGFFRAQLLPNAVMDCQSTLNSTPIWTKFTTVGINFTK